MDKRCPHCRQDLAFNFLQSYRKKGYVLAGDAALSCPNCAGAVTFNELPPEVHLPFYLTGDVAVFAIFGIAWLFALLLSPFFSVGVTTFVLGLIGLAALGIQQWHLYNVKFANFAVFRPAEVREIEAWKPTL